jgi:CubicO group peptidase (beta-lactamase class C family)
MLRTCATLLSLCHALPAAGDAVDDYVRGVMAKTKTPGVSVLVSRGGRTLRAQGYGMANVELQAPASADTVYQSGSVGKQFTAAGVLLLVEEGKLGLDDRLSKHFPEGPAAWHRISVRQLLTHSSGLKDYGSDEIDYRQDYDEQELLEVMRRVPLEFEPGTQWSYSNTGYLILGLLTSRLAGKHWSEFQAERIFAPLGMTTARVISEKDIVMNRAAGYELDEQGELKNQDWVSPSLNRCADGALYLTVKDLAAWERALRERRLLGPASYEAWWEPVELANGTTYPYGFGWEIAEQRGQRLIEHTGSWQGFKAAIARYPDHDLAVAVLANLAEAEPGTMAHEIAGIVEPRLALPDASASRPDPEPERAGRLREALAAFADSRAHPALARGLRETASGSAREAHQRRAIGTRLAEMTAFRYVGEDDLAARPLAWRGERITRVVHYALDTPRARHVYRFYLTQDGRVADFGSEER